MEYSLQLDIQRTMHLMYSYNKTNKMH